MSVFEIVMLLAFGAAWPVSIYKSYKSKATAGKSVVFLFIVLAGYVSGIMHKMLYNPDPVVWLYALNAAMVAVDIAMYFRNLRISTVRS